MATLAILGGTPVRTRAFPSWPLIGANDRQAWATALDDRQWCRLNGSRVDDFEKSFSRLLGVKHCTAMANGTVALFAALKALDIGPGDEVLVPPYTFVATINAILLCHALPIFIDVDRDTFQMDARRLATAVTGRTACILPVHIAGNPCDMDMILEVAGTNGLPVVEDACQGLLGEWRGRKLGTLGRAGCFSFQVGKNLCAGEGGALVTQDDAFAERCEVFHNHGRARTDRSGTFAQVGANLRLTEFQAALLLEQMTRLEEQTCRREENARHLTELLADLPGIYPARSHPGCTRRGWHLYTFRYDVSSFHGASRRQFIRALRAEGVSCSAGYPPLTHQPFLEHSLESRAYRTIYAPAHLNACRKSIHCPENDQLCAESVWLNQHLLLGERTDIEDIAEAIRKIHRHADELSHLAEDRRSG